MVKFTDKIQTNEKIFLKGLSKDRVSYDLVAGIIHFGDENSGHYQSIIRLDNNKWACLNDGESYLINEQAA